ncbi:hypothetical protein K1X76_00730 [bacterium]|nr:hypothetical protein [bacterium]
MASVTDVSNDYSALYDPLGLGVSYDNGDAGIVSSPGPTTPTSTYVTTTPQPAPVSQPPVTAAPAAVYAPVNTEVCLIDDFKESPEPINDTLAQHTGRSMLPLGLLLWTACTEPNDKDPETSDTDTGNENVEETDAPVEANPEAEAAYDVLSYMCPTPISGDTVTVIAQKPAGNWDLTTPYAHGQNVVACYVDNNGAMYQVGKGAISYGITDDEPSFNATAGHWVNIPAGSGMELSLPPNTNINPSNLVFYTSPQIPGTGIVAFTNGDTSPFTPFTTGDVGGSTQQVDVTIYESPLEGSGPVFDRAQFDYPPQWGTHPREVFNPYVREVGGQLVYSLTGLDGTVRGNTVFGRNKGTVVGSAFNAQPFTGSRMVASSIYVGNGYEANNTSLALYNDRHNLGATDVLGGNSANWHILVVARDMLPSHFCTETPLSDMVPTIESFVGDKDMPGPIGGVNGQAPGYFSSAEDSTTLEMATSSYNGGIIMGQINYADDTANILDLVANGNQDYALVVVESDEVSGREDIALCSESLAEAFGQPAGTALSNISVGSKAHILDTNIRGRHLDLDPANPTIAMVVPLTNPSLGYNTRLELGIK